MKIGNNKKKRRKIKKNRSSLLFLIYLILINTYLKVLVSENYEEKILYKL